MISRHSKEYCADDVSLIENYIDAMSDDKNIWHLHHRLETHWSNGERRSVDLSSEELKQLGVYYSRPSSELIFMTESVHRALHIENKFEDMCKKAGEKSKTLESRLKNSLANRGEKNAFYGKHHSEETKRILSEYHKNKKCYNNGKINVYAYDCPDGFVLGCLDLNNTRQKQIEELAKKRKGLHCYNNGKINVFSKDCPEGFVKGVLYKSEETKMKIMLANKGKKRGPLSEEQKKKISEISKGKKKSLETRLKMSESAKGKHWFTNGYKNVFVRVCPDGFHPGMNMKKKNKSISNTVEENNV